MLLLSFCGFESVSANRDEQFGVLVSCFENIVVLILLPVVNKVTIGYISTYHYRVVFFSTWGSEFGSSCGKNTLESWYCPLYNNAVKNHCTTAKFITKIKSSHDSLTTLWLTKNILLTLTDLYFFLDVVSDPDPQIEKFVLESRYFFSLTKIKPNFDFKIPRTSLPGDFFCIWSRLRVRLQKNLLRYVVAYRSC